MNRSYRIRSSNTDPVHEPSPSSITVESEKYGTINMVTGDGKKSHDKFNDRISNVKSEIAKQHNIKSDQIELISLNGEPITDDFSITQDIVLKMKPLIQADFINPRFTQFILYIGVFSDGAGDFSFANKMIRLLLSMKVRASNIHLNIVNINSGDVAFENFSEELMNQCFRKTNTKNTGTLTGITKEILDELKSTLTELSIPYKKFYEMKGVDKLSQLRPTILDLNAELGKKIDVNERRSRIYDLYEQSLKTSNDYRTQLETKLQQMEKEVQGYDSLLWKKEEEKSDEDKEVIKKYQEFKTLGEKINKGYYINDLTECQVKSQVFQSFLDNSLVSSFWSTFINNCKTYFIEPIEFKDIKINFVYTDNKSTQTVIDNVIKSFPRDNMIVVTFLSSKFSIDFLKKSPYDQYRVINIDEGGNCSDKYISGGFKSGNPKCIGINITPIEPLSLTVSPYTDGKYHVCYFGGLGNIDPYGILMGFKLKYFIPRTTVPLIFVNEICYNILKNNKEIYRVILGDYEVDEGRKKISINGKIISPFSPYKPAEFQSFLYHSEPLCILSGDQSYYEGISMGKIVLYDVLHHKVQLMRQIYQLYKEFVSTFQSMDEIDNINEISLKSSFMHISSLIKDQKFFVDKSGNNEPIKPLTLNDKESNDGNEITYKSKTQTLKISPTGFSFSIYKVSKDPYSNYGVPVLLHELQFDYEMLRTVYDKILKMCAFLLDTQRKEEFLRWLGTNYNFEQNLAKLIKYE